VTRYSITEYVEETRPLYMRALKYESEAEWSCPRRPSGQEKLLQILAGKVFT
jgi:hypothetical protein